MTRLNSSKHASPNMCYHAEFGRFALNCVGMNTKEPPKLEALELCFLGL